MIEKNILKPYAFILLAIGVFLSIYNIWIPYSYWWDELYSVTASSLPMKDMFSAFIMNDVHPPLYQIVLHYWIDAFGNSELSTRMLSLIFSLSALFLFSRFILISFSKEIAYPAIIIFSTSWLLSFYAQETRSYAMMLFLSTLLIVETLNYILKEEKTSFVRVSIAALLLSATHFFGLIFSGLVILYLFFYSNNKKNKAYFFVTGLLALVWPITHFILGSISSKTGGSFWIKSEGIQTTITVFLNSLIPHSFIINKIIPDSISEYVLSISGFIILLSLSAIIVKQYKNGGGIKSVPYNVFIFTAASVFLFISIVSLIDLYTPISTNRNFIVLLPVFSVLISLLISILKKYNRTHATLIIVFGFSSVIFSYVKINDKQYPLQNHSAAAEFIVEKNLLKTHNFYYRANLNSSMPEIQNLMARYYIEKITGKEIEATPLDPEAIFNLNSEEGFIFFSQHSKINIEEMLEQMREIGFKVDSFEPIQKAPGSTFIIYSVN